SPAADGIRYYQVTGVQTCALPIYGSSVHITWADSTYDATANPATATASGVAADGTLSPTPALAYYPGATATGTPLAGAPTDAGRSEERRVGKDCPNHGPASDSHKN